MRGVHTAVRIGHKLADHIRDLFADAVALVEEGLDVFRPFHDGKFDIAHDAQQHIVEVVGDAGGQLPDGIDLLRVQQLGF